MSVQFLYEDAQDNVIDEHGRLEPMDCVIYEEQYALETVSSRTQYLLNMNMPRESDRESDVMQTEDAKKNVDVHRREAPVKRVYTLHMDQNKARFFKLLFKKCLSGPSSVRTIRTASF